MAEGRLPQLHCRHDAEEERESGASYVTRTDMITTDTERKETKTMHDEGERAGVVTVTDPVPAVEPNVEAKDRGLSGDFMGKKEEEEKRKPEEEDVNAVSGDFEKVNVSEPEPEKMMEGKEEQLQGSHSVSSTTSSDEDEAEGGEEKKKKGLKAKIKEMVSGGGGGGGQREEEKSETKMPDKEVQAAAPSGPADQAEDNKSFMEKIKEKLPVPAIATARNTGDVPPTPPPTKEETHAQEGESTAEKKGIFEKIKEKIPGYQTKTVGGNEEKD